MTSRDSEGPRRTPPGPTPQLDAVERLRRQLESRDAKSARRGSRPGRSGGSEPSHDLFGRDSADPYTSTAGWNYGPSARADYRPAAEPNPAEAASTWRTTDAPDPATAYPSTREAAAREGIDGEATDRDREGTNHEASARDRESSAGSPKSSDANPEPPNRGRRSSTRAYSDDPFARTPEPLADEAEPTNPSRPHRRSPAGRGRPPGQWREEAPTA
ncbi:hypothetical protein ACFROC_18780, partial [Nocardia tengchongensis]